MIRSLALVLCVPLAALAGCRARPVPLPQAHAHNDYLHPRPLLDALRHGFCSVEADVHLVNGELLVAHDLEDVVPGRTLQRLYLDPLRERVRRNGGRVHRRGPTFTLLIDVKSEAAPTYAALHAALRPYEPMLRVVRDGRRSRGAVRVVISGHRATDAMAAQAERLASYDGRIEDLNGDTSPDLMPMISARWSDVFTWRGDGPMPPRERDLLRRLAEKVHAEGRRLRLWAAPDTEAGWAELRAAGVDVINTDDLAGLAAFLRSGRVLAENAADTVHRRATR